MRRVASSLILIALAIIAADAAVLLVSLMLADVSSFGARFPRIVTIPSGFVFFPVWTVASALLVILSITRRSRSLLKKWQWFAAAAILPVFFFLYATVHFLESA